MYCEFILEKFRKTAFRSCGFLDPAEPIEISPTIHVDDIEKNHVKVNIEIERAQISV